MGFINGKCPINGIKQCVGCSFHFERITSNLTLFLTFFFYYFVADALLADLQNSISPGGRTGGYGALRSRGGTGNVSTTDYAVVNTPVKSSSLRATPTTVWKFGLSKLPLEMIENFSFCFLTQRFLLTVLGDWSVFRWSIFCF